MILQQQRFQQERIPGAERMRSLLAPRPHDAEDHRRRGDWFYDRHHWKSARYAFDQAILLRPNDPHLYLNRAVCALIEDDDVSCVSDFRKVGELQPANPVPPQMLAWLYVTGKAEVRRSPEEALPLALKALRLDPRKPEARITLGPSSTVSAVTTRRTGSSRPRPRRIISTAPMANFSKRWPITAWTGARRPATPMNGL